jgi:hypothetical protein
MISFEYGDRHGKRDPPPRLDITHPMLDCDERSLNLPQIARGRGIDQRPESVGKFPRVGG